MVKPFIISTLLSFLMISPTSTPLALTLQNEPFTAWWMDIDSTLHPVTLGTGYNHQPASWSINIDGDSTQFTISSGISYNWIGFETTSDLYFPDPSIALTFKVAFSDNLRLGDIRTKYSDTTIAFNDRGDTVSVAFVWLTPVDSIPDFMNMMVVPRGIGVGTYSIFDIIHEAQDGRMFYDSPFEVKGQTVVAKTSDFPFQGVVNDSLDNVYHGIRASAGDVNCNGVVSGADVSLIMRRIVGYTDYWKAEDSIECPTTSVSNIIGD